MDSNVKNTESEPRMASSTLPMWLMLLLALFVYRGCLQVDSAGGFQAKVYPPYHEPPPQIGVEDPAAKGRKVYEAYCMPCHQANGGGLPGQFPPLAGSEWVQAEGVNRIARFVMNGLQGPITVKGTAFNGAMPPWKEVITSDEDVAAVLTYIRSSWGNKASAVTVDEIKKIRGEEASRGTSWTEPESLKISEK